MPKKTLPIPTLTPKQIAHFWSKVTQQKMNKCWMWQGAPCGGGGYGQIQFDGVRIRAHRLAYYLTHSQDPKDWRVCHVCDNPICVNPTHLFLGTDADNIIDRDTKHRRQPPQGTKNGRAKLTDEIIRLIRVSKASNLTLAARYAVTDVAISYARSGKTWKHVI